VDRLTRDLDAFIAAEPGNPPGDVRPLVAPFTAALAADGWTVQVVRDHVTFARLLATLDRETIEVDLAVDSPPLFPLERVDGIQRSPSRTSLHARSSRSSTAPRDETSPISGCSRRDSGGRSAVPGPSNSTTG